MTKRQPANQNEVEAVKRVKAANKSNMKIGEQRTIDIFDNELNKKIYVTINKERGADKNTYKINTWITG